jgi:4-hydroxythreonine-4-phosphate dehydrogenase
MALMLVLADDLTGAADCGVACAGHGLQTMLVLGDSEVDVQAEALAHAEALAVDGDTRRLPAHEAGAETARLLRRFLRSEEMLLYKKLDSTMRGNVGAELAATLEARRTLARSDDRIVVVLAPAFPATGRTTVNGQQLVNGEQLTESDFGRNDNIRGLSDIAAMLRNAQLRPALVGFELVRGEGALLQNAMRRMARDADVLVCDAETDDDLRRIADASLALGRETVWAGSGGLARHLLPAAGLTRARLSSPKPLRVEGTVLFVVGSGSAVTHDQMEVLATKSDTIVMRIPAEALLAGEQSPQWRAYGLELERALNAGRDVAVMPDPGARVDSAKGPLLTAALAAMVRPLGDRAGALVVTGGETARAVFEAWGVNRLRLIGEVEAGLPFSVTAGWSREIPVLTKAGGFGGPESLLRCQQFLNELNRGPGNDRIRSKGHQ